MDAQPLVCCQLAVANATPSFSESGLHFKPLTVMLLSYHSHVCFTGVALAAVRVWDENLNTSLTWERYSALCEITKGFLKELCLSAYIFLKVG